MLLSPTCPVARGGWHNVEEREREREKEREREREIERERESPALSLCSRGVPQSSRFRAKSEERTTEKMLSPFT